MLRSASGVRVTARAEGGGRTGGSLLEGGGHHGVREGRVFGLLTSERRRVVGGHGFKHVTVLTAPVIEVLLLYGNGREERL